MKVKFFDGTVKNCMAPIEQKVFRGETGAGWVLMLTLTGDISSEELDIILTEENIGELTFLTEDNVGISLSLGYSRVSSCTIRHGERAEDTRAEIQLTKGF